MNVLLAIVTMLVFPCGLFLLVNSVVYEWVDRKLVAQLQNRVGPRWFQPFADLIKLLAKEDVIPEGTNLLLFNGLAIAAIAATLTAALYVPIAGLTPVFSFPGDLIVTIYLLSLPTLCLGIAGMNVNSNYSILGSTRLLTQLFAYEAPLLLALLGPAFVAGSWRLTEITATNGGNWILFTQPIGFIVAIVTLMGKLELQPFNAPEAETEIVAGALTEYGGRGLALFMLAKKVTLVVGLTLIAAFYMGGIANPLDYLVKTLALLLVVAIIQTVLTRFRIDQTVTVWWRIGILLILAQWFLMFVLR
jgi:NADH-quinone oxidoreductase subunit H